MRLSNSRTVVILVFYWFCVIITSEAASLGDFCNDTITCENTGEVCNASSMCGCNTGYGEYNGECKSSSITVSLSGPSSSVIYGSPTNLTANITTSVDVTVVTWQKVGSGGSVTNINIDSTKYTQTGTGTLTIVLTINNLDFNDGGNYQVQVTNSLGKNSTSNLVSVDVAGDHPYSLNVSGPSHVVYGDKATYTGEYISVPGMTSITWQKIVNGSPQNITISSDGKYSESTITGPNPRLVINPVDFTDSGSYQMVVTNAVGSNTSDQFTLNVTGAKPNVNISPPKSTVFGQSATITAHVASEPPATSYMWQVSVNDITENITSNDTYNITVTGNITEGNFSVSLTINDVKFSDQANYILVVTNSVGSQTSNTITLNVTGGLPAVTFSPLGSAEHGQSAVITAQVTSIPKATGYKWQKYENKTDITASNKYTLEGSITEGSFPLKLTIKSLKFTDEVPYYLVVTNAVGTNTSSGLTLNVTGGELVITIDQNVTGRFGGNVTISCNVQGPERNKIQWKKIVSGVATDLTINGPKYSGGSLEIPSLTIHNLNDSDEEEYKCTASNPGGDYESPNTARVTLAFGEFNDSCDQAQVCNISNHLTCSDGNLCVCEDTHYHKDGMCYLRSHLKPSISTITNTASQFTVNWILSSEHNSLVTSFKVSWKVSGSSSLEKTTIVNENLFTLTVSSELVSGQLYTVTVTSVVELTNPAGTINIESVGRNVRLDSLPPGPIKSNESSFAHDNLNLKWTPPSNTFVTKYEVTIDNTIQLTRDSNPMLHFTMKSLTPGKYYVVSIVTISGISDEKKSKAYNETIRITPTKPDPPINVSCPQHPKDISLEISWEEPVNPNGQIVMYQIHLNPGSPTGLIINTTDDGTDYNVMGLSEEVMYNFTVQTINDAEETQKVSDPSEVINCSTIAGVSTPPTKLNISEIGSRSFNISFEKPVNVSGQLAAYRIAILEGSDCVQEIFLQVERDCPQCKGLCEKTQFIPQADINQPVVYQVTNLKPYTHYIVKVAAVNGNGEGRLINATANTDEETPQKPGNIRATNIEAKTLTLSWDVEGPSPGNTTYTVEVHEGTDDTGTNFTPKQPKRYSNGFHMKSLSIAALEEYWPYKFKVIAATVKGTNASDLSDIVKTKQAAPGKVENLTVNLKEGNYRVAYAYWNIPSLRERNGVLENYNFKVINQGIEILTGTIPVSLSIQRVEQNFTVVPEETYIVMVSATNNESMSGQDSQHPYRVPAGRPPIDTSVELISTIPGQHKSSQQSFTIELNTDFFRNDLNGKQVLFGITVCEVSKCTDQGSLDRKEDWERLPNWHDASKNGFPLYRVTNDTYMNEINNGGSRRKRSTSSEFTIGEDPACSSMGSTVYCNGPLNDGQSYRVILFACTNGGCSHSVQYGPYSTIKIIVEDKFPVGAVVGGVVAVIAAVLVVIIAVVVSKRRRLGTTSKYTEKLESVVDMEDPVPKNIPRKRPIRLRELADKVAEKHKDSNLYFAREYEDLKTLSAKHATEMSETDSNKLKNRYVNILPFDVTRVKLQLTEDDDPSTDFINANYLPGYKSEREYIATQGPIPGTIDDFWRMIWEQNVSIIVMLTLCKEEGRVKCEMYWPENVKEPKQYGDLVVETVSCSTVNFYDFRIFKIKLGDTTRTLKHFHFLQWKDFSANVQNDVMIDFIKNVRNHIRPPDMNGPVVVHCSAGVGRTGTYCALDHLFQVIDNHDLEHTIDIFDLVLNLREHRMFMVQTEQQYVFIHDCVRDYVERKRKEMQGDLLYENVNRAFVADDPAEESLYQNYSNQRTDL